MTFRAVFARGQFESVTINLPKPIVHVFELSNLLQIKLRHIENIDGIYER